MIEISCTQNEVCPMRPRYPDHLVDQTEKTVSPLCVVLSATVSNQWPQGEEDAMTYTVQGGFKDQRVDGRLLRLSGTFTTRAGLKWRS